eukprot:6190295-Pleurochrysis_carterae.AAC.4
MHARLMESLPSPRRASRAGSPERRHRHLSTFEAIQTLHLLPRVSSTIPIASQLHCSAHLHSLSSRRQLCGLG